MIQANLSVSGISLLLVACAASGQPSSDLGLDSTSPGTDATPGGVQEVVESDAGLDANGQVADDVPAARDPADAGPTSRDLLDEGLNDTSDTSLDVTSVAHDAGDSGDTWVEQCFVECLSNDCVCEGAGLLRCWGSGRIPCDLWPGECPSDVYFVCPSEKCVDGAGSAHVDERYDLCAP